MRNRITIRPAWLGCILLALFLGLSGCASSPNHKPASPPPPKTTPKPAVTASATPPPAQPSTQLQGSGQGAEVVLFALGLLDIGYQFGGKNPESGLDCSGMVSYIYQQALGLRLTGNAAAMARQGRMIALDELRGGDLIFFNTLGRPYSHVGIFIGEGKFVHAPSSNKKIRIDSFKTGYFANRIDGARALLP